MIVASSRDQLQMNIQLCEIEKMLINVTKGQSRKRTEAMN